MKNQILASLSLVAAALGATITVQVGPGLIFTPSTVTANVGDVIQFTVNGRHTATQTTFDDPCAVLEGGFYFSSGTNSITVNDTNPIWYNCQIRGHCTAGMVGVINPSSTQTFAAFAAAAEGGKGLTGTVTSSPAAAAPATSSAEDTSVAAAALPSGLYGPSQSGFSAFPADASYSLVGSGATQTFEVVETFEPATTGGPSAATGTLIAGPSEYVLSVSASGAPSDVNVYASCSVSGSQAVCVEDGQTTFTAPFAAATQRLRRAARWQ